VKAYKRSLGSFVEVVAVDSQYRIIARHILLPGMVHETRNKICIYAPLATAAYDKLKSVPSHTKYIKIKNRTLKLQDLIVQQQLGYIKPNCVLLMPVNSQVVGVYKCKDKTFRLGPILLRNVGVPGYWKDELNLPYISFQDRITSTTTEVLWPGISL